MDSVILTTCDNTFEAHLIRHQLENAGISCFLANENFANLMPHYYRIFGSGVQVYVNQNDLERAHELIADKSDDEKVVCPNCGSSNITFGLGKRKVLKWIFVFISSLFLIPFNNINNRFYCKDCKTEFKKHIM